MRRSLWKYLKDLHATGKTILLTNHYIEEAEKLCENVAIIDEGKILKEGSPKKLTQELGSSGITIHLNENNQNLNTILADYCFTLDQNRLHFSVKDSDLEMPKIIQTLSNNNFTIQSVEATSSSLEDVFLDLTGKDINK